MKDILANININCLNGLCEHTEHKVNSLWWILLACALTYGLIKIKKAKSVDN